MLEPRLRGIWYASDRQTAFFHVPDGTDHRALFRQIFPPEHAQDAPDGGVVENGCFITTPDDQKFQAITWWGKRLRAWRHDFEATTVAHGITTARFFQRRFILSTGKRFWYRDLVITED